MHNIINYLIYYKSLNLLIRNRQDEMRGFEDVRNSKSHTSRGPEGVAGGGSRSVAVENKYAALRGADQS